MKFCLTRVDVFASPRLERNTTDNEFVQLDWSECPETEVIAGKVSGLPILIGTRIPAEAITVNFESALRRGMTPDQAISEASEDYPGADMQRIKRLLEYYHSRQLQSQL